MESSARTMRARKREVIAKGHRCRRLSALVVWKQCIRHSLATMQSVRASDAVMDEKKLNSVPTYRRQTLTATATAPRPGRRRSMGSESNHDWPYCAVKASPVLSMSPQRGGVSEIVIGSLYQRAKAIRANKQLIGLIGGPPLNGGSLLFRFDFDRALSSLTPL